jgi:hypothetical protein
MNEQEETKDCQRLILEALRGFKAHGVTEVDQENIRAAVKLLLDLETQQALLNLLYKGEITGRVNDEDDVEFIAANSEAS